ncbi:hypothetical protein B0H11DRAFT_2093195 [Mycena galericulata]|nr:hypothetical protein B0H11DRAFT_2093195 [Mycena galericulata]
MQHARHMPSGSRPSRHKSPPLPYSPQWNRTSGRIIGGAFHFFHLCVRVKQVQNSDLGCENIYCRAMLWFNWTVPMTILLVAVAVRNTVDLFFRIKLYHLRLRRDPVSSPNATLVDALLDFQPLQLPSPASRFLKALWFSLPASRRFPLAIRRPAFAALPSRKTVRMQQLEMWLPGELEMTLFNLYSPVHAFLWMATDSSNWMLMLLLMSFVSVQANAMTHSYKALLKDKDIIYAEVLNEYNRGFVYPRINPVRKDVAVMVQLA